MRRLMRLGCRLGRNTQLGTRMKPGGAAVVLLTVISLGCSDTPNAEAGVPGTYDALGANGQTLPVALPKKNNCTDTAIRGAVTLLAAGRFTATYTYRRQCGNVSSDLDGALGGSYLGTSTNLIFHPDSGFKGTAPTTPVVGSVSGSTLTLIGFTASGLQTTITARRR
jgi:hypothetical protein